MIESHNRLKGQQVRLGALLEEDIKTILGWYCDTRFLDLWDSDPLVDRTESAVSDWMDELDGDRSQVVFGLRRLGNDKLVGMAHLDDIEWSNRVADIGVAIGNPTHWGKGWGTEATRLLVNYGFTELNLYRLQLSVMAYNTRAIGLYEKIGFKHEGTWREFGERNEKRYHMHLYGLLRHEWDNKEG